MQVYDDLLRFKNKCSPEITLRSFSVKVTSSGNSHWNIIRQLMTATVSDATSADWEESLTAEPQDAHDMFNVSGVRPAAKSATSHLSFRVRPSLLQDLDEMLKTNLQNVAMSEANRSGSFNHRPSDAEINLADVILSSVVEYSDKEPEKNIPLTTPAERSARCR